MRPGPGLVVMALAFISGARRGSTSSNSSKTTTTTSSPPPQILATTTLTSSLTLLRTTVTTSSTTSSPFFNITPTTPTTTTGTSVAITTTSTPPTQPSNIYENLVPLGSKLDREHGEDLKLSVTKRPKKPERFNFFNIFFTRTSYNAYFAYSYPLPSHLTQQHVVPRVRTESKSVLHSGKHTRRSNAKFRRRRKRRTHSANVNFKGSSTGSDETTENLNNADDTLLSLTTAVDSSSDKATVDRGPPVQFPSLTAADSSRSLDEDDIFALVAEDDLLSEESFDHLLQLTNDKIGDTNEEDYSSNTETAVESSSGSGSGTPDNIHDTPQQHNAIDDLVPTHQQQYPEQDKQQLQKLTENLPLPGDDVGDVDDEGKEEPNNDHNSEQDVVVTVYNAHLVSNSNEEVVLLNEADSTHSTRPVTAEKERRQVTITSKAELDSSNRYQTILDSNFAVTRLNPWISACDLAQPGPISAPDLQGECSAGTLPVAWVDEGPGPPTCLKSCKEETPFTNKLNKDNMITYLINNNSNNNNSKKYKNKSDNKLNKLVGYTTTTNTFNIKLRNSQPTTSHSMNTNNNDNSNNNIKNKDNNNKNNNNIIQKLLNSFSYYQMNNNNNKMAKARINAKETSSARSDYGDSATIVAMNVAQINKPKDFQALPLPSSEDYEVLHDMLLQQDEAASNKEIEQQIEQQNYNNNDVVKSKSTATNYNDNNSHQNNQNNQFELKYNHIKKDQLGNYNNNNNKMYQSDNINNSPQRSDTLPTPAPPTPTTTNNKVAVNNLNNDQYLNMPPPEKEEQQCLEYLGDSDITMPSHLCHLLTPSERLAQLRYLRLRNCCERNVYSALHILALNTTLSGGAGCLRVLEDLINLDALASRITCGLTEILFRFDCRQVYSIVHQCDDCKEAYRRWVCSTLVPYFAETDDIMKPPQILTTIIKSTSAGSADSSGGVKSLSQSYNSQTNSFINNNTTMASNMTTSHNTSILPNSSNHENNNSGTDMSSVVPLKTVTSNFITNSNKNKYEMHHDTNNYQQQFHKQQEEQRHIQRRHTQHQQFINKSNITSNSNNNNKTSDCNYNTILINRENQTQQQQHSTTLSKSHVTRFYDIIAHNSWSRSPKNSLSFILRPQSVNGSNPPIFEHNIHHKLTNKRRKRSGNSTITTTIYADAFDNRPSMSSSSSSSPSSLHHTHRQEAQPQQQSLNFISTANNEDSFYVKNPVITNLLKRSKRKEFEFRKRRRIRPCLSVCQTVEQKCPYLLPADRAPSMPTQYAGEPTFLCLDYDIAETEDQLRKASHGPNDCCYTYCSHSADGICTYCKKMWDKTDVDKDDEVLKDERETKVFNITMKTKEQGESAAMIKVETKIQQKIGEQTNSLQMATVAIAVRNNTAFENATRLAERLKYYAFCDGIFYYDDDAEDMPEYPNSENCRQLPPVQSRCSIPYYATNYISSADMLGSYQKHKEAQKLLIWLSTLLCLWSCYSARSVRMTRYNEKKRQQLHKLINTVFKDEHLCQKCHTCEIMPKGEKVIKLWHDYRDSKVLIIYWLSSVNRSDEKNEIKNSLSKTHLVVRHLRKIPRSSSAKLNCIIFKIPTIFCLINYKEFLLLIFKKRQKLRKPLNERSWSILRHSSCKTLKKSKPKTRSFNKNKIQYYYYRSFSQIFSCSCNRNITNYNYYNDTNTKKLKFNFKNYTNYNKNNKMMIMKFNYKIISILKFNTITTITTAHTFIINSYNNSSSRSSSSSKTNCYNNITVITVSYNFKNNSDNNSNKDTNILKNNFSIKLKKRHRYYYFSYSADYNCIRNNNRICKSNKKINNRIVLLKLSTSALKLPSTLPSNFTSTITITIKLYNLLATYLISKIMLMIKLTMLIMLIMPLFFTSFMKMKYNKNHHMKIIIKDKTSFSPNTIYNSKKTNYRYFYYFNFNIYDWWQRRRWCRRRSKLLIHQIVENPNYHNTREFLLFSGQRRHRNFVQEILL